MNAAQAQRLLEEQTRALQQTEERAQQMTKFRDDYKALKDRLQTLPDKITHDVMVPFGKLAFMPGRLVHTNEVTVLLGDNWFVERSAKQACEIVDRRVEAIDDQLGELEKQRGLLEPRKEFTQDLSGKEREIREEYDEQRERQWKVKHRENMKKYKLQERKEEKRRAAETERTRPLTDDEMWSRLDDLEEQELKHREMEKLDDELREGTHDSPDSRLKLKAEENEDWDEDDDDDDDDWTEDSDDYEDDDDEIGEARRPTSIRFSHTKSEGPNVTSNKPLSDEATSASITSPADIYTIFSPLQGPRSILKSPGSAGTNQRVTITEPESTKEKGPQDRPARPQPQTVGRTAFTGSIVERHDTTPVEAPGPPAPQAPTQRVSKFKAQRMKQNR